MHRAAARERRRRGAVLLAVLGLVGLAGALPAAAAAPARPLAWASLEEVLQADRLRLETPTTCDSGTLARSPASQGFTFSEEDDERGCGLVTYRAAVPAGATQGELSFTASRAVADASAKLAPGASAVEQEAGVRQGNATEREQLFFPDEGDRDPRAFRLPFTLALGQETVDVQWWFADVGRLASPTDPANPGRLDAFVGVVADAHLAFHDVPLPETHLRRVGGHQAGDQYVQDYGLDSLVPPSLGDAVRAGRVGVTVVFPDTLLVLAVTGPGGELASGDFTLSAASGLRRLDIAPATLAEHGPGWFRLRVVLYEVLETAVPLATLATTALVLPLLTFPIAFAGLRRRVESLVRPDA